MISQFPANKSSVNFTKSQNANPGIYAKVLSLESVSEDPRLLAFEDIKNQMKTFIIQKRIKFNIFSKLKEKTRSTNI